MHPWKGLGHLVLKTHPEGGFKALGISPFSSIALDLFSGSIEGIEDNNALVYIIASHEEEIQINCPIMFKVEKDAIAICCDHRNGPIYGDGHDIHIGDACDERVMLQVNGRWGYCPQWDARINFGCVNWSRLRNYKIKMINSIAKLCEISNSRINIKGKTTEKLGVIGEKKAIACEVIVSVINYD